MSALAGRVALVTGAGRGIGRAVAVELAASGAGVALLARSLDQLEETAARIEAGGGAARVVAADLADRTQVVDAAARARSQLGGVDILINNAGVVAPVGPTTRISPLEWAASLEVNVLAIFQLTAALLPSMLERGWGRIVNVSSGIAAHPGAAVGMNAYATGKAALEAHTLNLAAEVDGSGVTVNGYRPGSVDTAMQAWIRAQDPERIGSELHRRFVESHAAGVPMSPERSARALVARLSGEENGLIWDVADA